MYDVLIIGAGPAGSAAACILARGGAKVALLDRTSFPRDKACGDMLSSASLRALERLGLSSFLQAREIRSNWQAQFLSPGENVIRRDVSTRHEDGNLKWMAVPRVELDAALVNQANKLGAEVLEGIEVKELKASGRGVQLIASGIQNGNMDGYLAIIATGSLGTFRLDDPELFALRGYYEGKPPQDLLLSFQKEILPGYLWQFPVGGNRYNIGVGMEGERALKIRADRLLAESSILEGMVQVGEIRGAFINTSYGRKLAHAERVLWVGDAAGLVQPHLAEGLSPALRSGEIAGHAALQALEKGLFSARDLAFYTEGLNREFMGELRISRFLHWMMSHPRLLDWTGRTLANYHSRLIRLFSSEQTP